MPATSRDVSAYPDNYYEILQLTDPVAKQAAEISKEDLKAAYHRALLLHHPDKVPKVVLRESDAGHGTNTAREPKYSIDQIMRAFQTLSDPTAKKSYDDYLVRAHASNSIPYAGDTVRGAHLGIEVMDLDDLAYTEADGSWSAPCRCGNSQGYRISESDLEREAQEGEIYVGCEGCSLFVKVLFGIAEDAGA